MYVYLFAFLFACCTAGMDISAASVPLVQGLFLALANYNISIAKASWVFHWGAVGVRDFNIGWAEFDL